MKTEFKKSQGFMMTRGQFLRTLGLGAGAAVGVVTGLGRIQQADAQVTQTDVAVYPTGDFPYDVDEVSAAVNGGVGPSGQTYLGGGVVRLKATNIAGAPMFFNFGGDVQGGRGSVSVEKDVTILGEPMPPTTMTFPPFPYDRAPDTEFTPDRTVIYGGKRPFWCTTLASAPVKLVVRSVFFAYPWIQAVVASMTAGLEISDCVIYDIKPDDTGLGFSAADAIEVTAAGTFPNQRLSGDFRVVNNRIRRASLVDYPPQFIEGGVILNLSSMTTSIVANEIEGFAFVGIGIDRNDGPVTIAGNRVINCGHGGALLALPSSSGIGFRGTTAPALVERNTITGGYAGPSQSFLSRIALGLASSNVVLRSNSVGGAFVLEPVLLSTFVDTARSRSFSATDNRIETNDLSEATGNQAQVVLDQASDRNRFANNDYGSVGEGAEAGVVVRSANNAFVNEDFWGTYTGAPSQPCVKLTPTSSGNSVSAFKYQGAPQGFDVCQQVLDQGMNTVTGAQKCG